MKKEHTHEREQCGHTGCCGHHREPNHGEESGNTWRPAVSLLMLAIGLSADYAGCTLGGMPWARPLWYATAAAMVGLPIVREALEALRHKDVCNEFTLMGFASIGAFAIGEYPEAVAVLLFYTVGETLQHGAVDRATRNIGRLLDVRPERARVWRNGTCLEVDPATVKTGEQIEVRTGERVPLDGVLQDGEASFDTSALTGESMPRTMRAGDEVLAGMISSDRPVRIITVRPYDQSALARILHLVKDASERKAPAELFIRRFARIYTPVVILLAALIMALPALLSLAFPFPYVFADWLYRGLVFLVISCPCALVISVPLGYFAGIGAASRRGILFKGGNYLDAVTRVDSVAFDKTGTLTRGTFEVTAVKTARGTDENTLLAILLAVEEASTHPVARAVVRYARRHNISGCKVERMTEIAGHGVKAAVDGRDVLAGNISLLTQNGIDIPEEIVRSRATAVVCAIDGAFAGALLLNDELKADAVATVRSLRELGFRDIHLLSGDKQEVVDECARQLAIQQAHGGLMPADKARHIEQLTAGGHTVAFVGDGMNDAPVLALSHVGIAMGGLGSDAAIESADIVIQTDQPHKVATAIRIGRTTARIVRQNVVGAISAKVIVLIAGALGFASLWGAVFADVGVALLAVLNSMRILYKRVE